MHDRQSSHQRNTDLDERKARPPRNGEDERDEENKTDLEEDRKADDECDEHDGPMHTTFTEPGDQCGSDTCCAARFRHQLAQHGAEGNDDGDEPEDASDAGLERVDYRAERHVGHDAKHE